MPENSVNYEVLSPVEFLQRSTFVFGHKEAVVYGNKRYTYNEFQSRVFRLANALKKAGIQKGDKVAFVCPNIPPMLEAHFAVPMIGAALVSVNIRLAPKEVVYIINDSDAKALFVDNEFANLVSSNMDEIPNVKTVVNICDVSQERPLKGLEYEEFLAGASDAEVQCEVDDERSMLALNYTSGTTGLPKGVMYHHRGGYMNAVGEALEHGLNSTSVYLWTLPMFHCNGWCFPWAVTAVGGTHVCLRKVVPEEIYRLVEEEGVSHLCAAPTVLISMSSYPGAKDVKMRRPLSVITGGAPPAPVVIKNMEAIGASVKQVYGLTEVYGPHLVCETQAAWNGKSDDELAKIAARQGVPYITAVYADVVDPETMQPVPHNGAIVGEIVMRGNNVMLGYYKQPAATEEAFKDGWFHSGDLAVVYPDGYVEIKDRSKDIIISGGENISSVEVENVLYMHPDVEEVAVIGAPDEKWGEVPKAFIVAKPGANPSAEGIKDFCRKNMARFKVPKQIEFRPLPKTATGKIMKHILRNKEWEGRERKVN
jgi:fatty-acyl-CoA synthase